MPSQEFVFALAVSGGTSLDMLIDLTSRILERAGASETGAAALGEAVHAAIGQSVVAATGAVEVEFRAGDGRLRIVVSSPSGEIWQTSQEIA